MISESCEYKTQLCWNRCGLRVPATDNQNPSWYTLTRHIHHFTVQSNSAEPGSSASPACTPHEVIVNNLQLSPYKDLIKRPLFSPPPLSPLHIP